MVKVPSATEIEKAYEEAIPAVPAKYKRRVEATSGFIDAAVAGEELYGAKVSEAVANQTRAKALRKLTDEDWKKPAVEKGATRIGPGMRAASKKRTSNFEPFRSALESVSLPEKQADPIANVDNRVKPIVQAMIDTKKRVAGV